MSNVPNYVVTISGVPVTIEAGTMDITNTIGKRSQARFTIRDKTGTQHYQQNQRVIVLNKTSGLWDYSGFLDKPTESQPGYGPLLLTDCLCKDNHFLADKRIWAASYANQTAGFIANDILTNVLSQENVYAIKNLLSVNQSSVETSTTGFTASDGFLLNSGATLTRVTSQSYYGAASLQVVTDGNHTSEGVATSGIAALANWNYTASAYVLMPAGVSFEIRLRDATNNLRDTAVIQTGTGAWQRVSTSLTTGASAVGNLYLAILVTTQPAQTFYVDGLMIEPNAVATSWELGQTSSIAPGPTLTQETFNYVHANSALDTVASHANMWWAIDQYLRLWLQAQAAVPAPWTFDGSQAQRGQTTVDNNNPTYRNQQYIIGGTDITAQQVETRQGDGKTKAFAMSYDLSSVPTITLNGVSQTVGTKGTSGKQWYWAKGDPVIAQDASGTTLVSTDTLSVTYVGQFPTIIISQDTGQVTQQQALMGFGTGLEEEVLQDKTVTSATVGFAEANALLGRYGTQGLNLQFWTMTPGLEPGQLLTCNYAPHNLVNAKALIESVEITDGHDGLNLWYKVQAIIGPYDTTWIDFYKRVVNGSLNPTIDTSDSTSNTITALLQNLTLTWPTWTIALTPSVYACPLPGSTQYPSTTLYPC